MSKHSRDALPTYAYNFLLNILLNETIIFKILQQHYQAMYKKQLNIF